MGKKVKVQFVCNGNHDRSVAAEAFANQWIKEHDLENLIEVSSAGLFVTNKESPAYDWVSKVLRRAVNRTNLLTPDERIFVMQTMTLNDYDQALELFRRICPHFVEEATGYREMLGPKLGITEALKHTPTQFEPKEDLDAILCMTKDQRGRIRQTYNLLGKKIPPVTAVLPDFAGRMGEEEVNLHLGQDYDHYCEAMSKIKLCVGPIMEKIYALFLEESNGPIKNYPTPTAGPGGWHID